MTKRKDLNQYDLAWLAQHKEKTIDPELRIVDPHHHFWKQSRFGRYLLDDLWSDTECGHLVEKTVFLECSSEYRKDGPEELRCLGETEFVSGLADQAAKSKEHAVRVAGIVGHADLTMGARVEEVLQAHLECSELFRGIRHRAAWDQELGGSDRDTRIYANKSFREGFATLAPLGLSFDAWNFFTQMPELVELADALPETTIIMNHLGGPLGVGSYAQYREEVFARWQQHISALSRCQNVVMKLGGLGMPHAGNGWHQQKRPPGSEDVAAAYLPYCLHAIEQFGPERCMFESNFPVDKISMSYQVLWNAFKLVAAGFSVDERKELFSGTAERVYRLN